MANTNIKSATKLFDSRLWGGVSSDDTAWQTGAATGTMSMGVVEVVIDDGDLASVYALDLATNPVTGTEIIAILGIFSTTAAGNAITAAGNISTTTDIKWLPTAADGADTTYRLVFLYR